VLPDSAAGWAERAWSGLLQVAPLRTYTKLIRVMSGIALPRPLRRPLFGAIATRMGMDLGEAEQSISDYRCFGDLFVRRLRPGLRPVEEAADVVVSPVDGCVSGLGQAYRGGLIQAKGIEYPLAELVDSPELARSLDGGVYATLYLRPGDYHRIHCPISGQLVALRRIGGKLFPVQPYVVRNLRGLFVKNERIVLELETCLGKVAMVCVAAAGVGSISTAFDDLPGSNGDPRRGPLRVPVRKGDEIARFNLGSTVILVFEPNAVRLAGLAPGGEVRMGQPVARRLVPTSDEG
jgi:phosphatidylserine decarboxylase